MATQPVQLESVQSSALIGYGYDAAREVLAVQFPKGPIWHYAQVSPDVAAEFGAATSKGQFFASTIKGRFPGRRVTGPCKSCKAEGYVGETCADCGCDKHYAIERREEA